MSQHEKILKKLENNKNDVLASELDGLLRRYGFLLHSNSATHRIYVHPQLSEQVTIVVKNNKVKRAVYVDKALSAIKKVMPDEDK